MEWAPPARRRWGDPLLGEDEMRDARTRIRGAVPLALLLLAASATAPSAAAGPAAPASWAGWWGELTAWVVEWLPVPGKTVAASSDGEEPAADGEEPPPEEGDPPLVMMFGDGDHDEGGPYWDPDG
jgi:hypothetical protein